MVIIWGWIICYNTNFRIGTAIGTDNEVLLGSYYVRFITVRDSVLIPLAMITSLSNYLANNEPSMVYRDLCGMFPFLKKCCGAPILAAAIIVPPNNNDE